MQWDIANQLSVAQAFTGATTVSTNSYQKQTAAQDLSIGRRMSILLIPTVSAGAGSTHTFDAIQTTDAVLTASLDILNTITVLAAALILGAQFELPFPQKTMTKQFLGYQNTSTGGTTTVTMDAYFMPADEIAAYRSFPKAVDALV